MPPTGCWAREASRWPRRATRELAGQLLDAVVPAAADVVLDRIDLTALVLRRVDLDEIAAGLDLDAAAERIDVGRILDRIDMDELIEQRVDLDRIAARIDVVL